MRICEECRGRNGGHRDTCSRYTPAIHANITADRLGIADDGTEQDPTR